MGYSYNIEDKSFEEIVKLLSSRIRKIDSSCWIWVGANANGYGYIKPNKKYIYVHRLLHEKKHGKIPKNKELHHKCEIVKCVNPDHTKKVTRSEHLHIRGPMVGWDNYKKILRLYKTGKTQKELAKMFQVTPRTIHDYVRGKYKPCV